MILKLREKKLKNGKTSLYLAYWNPDHKYQVTRGKDKGQWKSGQWEYQFLKLYLGKDNALNKQTMILAESIKAKRQLELQNRQNGLKSTANGKENFVKYFEDLKEKKYPAFSICRTTLNHLRNYTGGYLAFKDINKEWIENFRSYLLKKVSRNTASTYFVMLKIALKMAANDEILEKNPGKNVKCIKPIEVKKVYLTLDEIKSLYKTQCQNDDLKQAFLFGCFSGLRISDLRRLTWGDIKKDENGYKLEFRQKKTKGVQYLPLNETAINFLNLGQAKAPDEKIFDIPSRYRTPGLFDNWIKQAGVTKHIRFHTARHTFATLSLTHGVDLYTVSKLLGHKSIATTQVYAKVVDEKKREAVNMLPVIQRPSIRKGI